MIVLKVENISKQYRLGQLGTGTISHDLNRWFHKVRGKEDPYLKLGDVNDRSVADGSEYVWSLKDINFEVKQGEVLGIIGKNGAGKSTLLKILSQVTTPTTGQIKVNGRIAALLEVGTGFHPDLTGRENIFLNGAILGMTKQEIKIKFDEIIDFSGVAKYIDTPVKRYSSGMMVRLGFAVAAHLDPEILSVDEVLAVGDQEFQDKCIGKMKDVSGQGRTVIFVSHNLGAIKSLCTRAILLKNGKIVANSDTSSVLNIYQNDVESKESSTILLDRTDRKGTGNILAKSIELLNKSNVSAQSINAGESFKIVTKTKKNSNAPLNNFYFALIIKDNYGDRLATISSDFLRKKIDILEENEITFEIKKCPLSTGAYHVSIILWEESSVIDEVENAFSFNVVENDYFETGVLQGSNIDKFFIDYSCNVK